MTVRPAVGSEVISVPTILAADLEARLASGVSGEEERCEFSSDVPSSSPLIVRPMAAVTER